MINPAVADIICPAVAAEDPLRPLHEVIVIAVDAAEKFILAFLLLKKKAKQVGTVTRPLSAVTLIKPELHCCLKLF